jgi:aminopeptidase N
MKLQTLLFCTILFFAQAKVQTVEASRADSLRGSLSEFRASYDVLRYDIAIELDPYGKVLAEGDTEYHIQGKVRIYVAQLVDFERLQFDLFAHYQIHRITDESGVLLYEREGNAVFITWPGRKKGDRGWFEVDYSGSLPKAQRPPWDGGFVFSKDRSGKPWIGVACEGFGASSWWPCKDHLSDEPDTVSMQISIPENTGLMAVSNGRLINRYTSDGKETFHWMVINPINSYNVTLYIADYEHFTESHLNSAGQMQELQYYVLRGNVEKAKKHFEQIGPMIHCFEQIFGPYAFWEDGFKMVESSYWGMEHQSAIAYGNQFRNNKWGFDFIIVHESGHEWWGNAVSVADHADMWIHEGLTTYSETLYLEYLGDTAKARQYLQSQRKNIRNEYPVVGPYDINFQQKDSDVYFKGAWVVHTIRRSLNNDSIFFNALRDVYEQFTHKTIYTPEFLDAWDVGIGQKYRVTWSQYLYRTEIPRLIISKPKKGKKQVRYKWEGVSSDFYLPIHWEGERLIPGMEWQPWPQGTNVPNQGRLEQDYLIEVVYR